MTENDNPAAVPAGQNRRTDPLDPMISAALMHQLLRPIDEDRPADASDALTDDDRAVLEALGSPQDVARRMMSMLAPVAKRAGTRTGCSDTSGSRAETPTDCTDLDATQPGPGSQHWHDSHPQSFSNLLDFMETFHQAESVTWTGRYRKARELGRGFQGVVFLTEYNDAMSGFQAMKIFSPKPYGDVDSYREDMNRMSQVASGLHRLHHENLVDVQRFLDHHGIFVMIMQWIDGFDLHRLMQRESVDQVRGHVTEERWAAFNDIVFTTLPNGRLCLQPGIAVHIIEKCLRGLDAMHGMDVVHGDIKPSNIMLGRHGSCKLIDIGSAFELKVPPREHTWTPLYAAPEFFEKGICTPQSDLASLGYILIELLSGQPAISIPSAHGEYSTRTMNGTRDPALLEAKWQLPDRFPELLPLGARRCQRLTTLCRRLIAPNPRERFASATEAIEGPDGTFNFSKELTRGNLVVHYDQEIKRWITDVNKVIP